MSDSAQKSFRCQVEVKHAPNGDLEFHVTKRDGTIEVIPGPPGLKQLSSNVEAFQRPGSDAVELLFA